MTDLLTKAEEELITILEENVRHGYQFGAEDLTKSIKADMEQTFQELREGVKKKAYGVWQWNDTLPEPERSIKIIDLKELIGEDKEDV